MIPLILFSLYSLSFSSILDFITNPDRYHNCLADYLTEEECKGAKGEWEVIERNNCENKGFSSKNSQIGVCCNMECLSGFGKIKIEMENNRVCKINKNKENFYGFKDYTRFNELFMKGVGYTEENTEYNVFQKLINNNQDFKSVYCSFDKKEDLILGLSSITIGKFYYTSSGGKIDGPTEDSTDNSIVGFDCSGLVLFLIDKVSDFKFENTKINSNGLYQIAVKNNFIKSTENLEIGDVLFYLNTTTNEIFHTGVYIGEGKKIHAGHTGDMIEKSSAIYNEDDVQIFAADFININKEEDTSKEIEVIGFTGTQDDTSSDGNKIKDTNLFSDRIKINIFILLGVVLFLFIN